MIQCRDGSAGKASYSGFEGRLTEPGSWHYVVAITLSMSAGEHLWHRTHADVDDPPGQPEHFAEEIRFADKEEAKASLA